MKKNKYTKLTWRCTLCNDTVVSFSNKRWNMDFCKCGKSGVDLEEWYQRGMGSVVEISREEMDI